MPKLSDLKKGEKGKIVDVSSQEIPMKLLEMGCLPGNSVRLIQKLPFRVLFILRLMEVMWQSERKLPN